jgi:hypothetical protein
LTRAKIKFLVLKFEFWAINWLGAMQPLKNNLEYGHEDISYWRSWLRGISFM